MKAAFLSASVTLVTVAPGMAHPEHEFMAGLSAPSPATVLLITGPDLVDSWKPFAAWKKRLGKPVSILSTAQIAERYEAKDLQEKIRRCIRNHTDHLGTRWIILGGDSEEDEGGIVPSRVTNHDGPSGYSSGLPADIYYLSKKDWDSDNDGIYGEWEEDRDSIDYPDGDVGLGRIPVRNRADVKAYTEKVIAYESRYPQSNYATSMAYASALGGILPEVKTGWSEKISKVLAGGTIVCLPAAPERGNSLGPAEWMSLFNGEAYGKLHLHGPGSHDAWILKNNRVITNAQIAQLTNKEAYPVITTTSSHTGQFDRDKDPSIAESMIRVPGRGAIAIVAPSRSGPSPEQEEVLIRFWEHGLGQKVSAGAALSLLKAELAADAASSYGAHLLACELNLLGDPTLGLRGAAPRTPAVKAPRELPPGNLSLIIESDAPHAIVSLQDDFGLYAVTLSDESGNVVFPLNVVEESTITITVSGPEYNAVTHTITVR